MKHLLSAVVAIMLSFAIGIPDAEAAKRMGGGKSVGTQRQSVQQQAAPKPAQPAQAAPAAGAAAAPAAAAKNRWLGPVAGLLAGGLLGAMLFGGAFDGIKFMDIAMILLLAAGVFFIFRMMRKPQQQAQRAEPMQYAGAGADPRVEPAMPQTQPLGSAAPAQPAGNYFPAGFDAESFARQAKQQFVRLQEAHDLGDLTALRGFMTPAMFKEIEAQVRERGATPQKTEVVTLDARVVEVVTEGDHYIASVRFNGMVKEDAAGQPEHFAEVWHLQKPLNGSTGWQIAGIQQD